MTRNYIIIKCTKFIRVCIQVMSMIDNHVIGPLVSDTQSTWTLVVLVVVVVVVENNLFETFSEIMWYISNASPVVNKGSKMLLLPRRSDPETDGNGCTEAPVSYQQIKQMPIMWATLKQHACKISLSSAALEDYKCNSCKFTNVHNISRFHWMQIRGAWCRRTWSDICIIF